MRYSHFAHVPDPGVFTRRLTPEQGLRIVQMKDERGLTYGAIAAWFSRNGTPLSYSGVRYAYQRAK